MIELASQIPTPNLAARMHGYASSTQESAVRPPHSVRDGDAHLQEPDPERPGLARRSWPFLASPAHRA